MFMSYVYLRTSEPRSQWGNESLPTNDSPIAPRPTNEPPIALPPTNDSQSTNGPPIAPLLTADAPPVDSIIPSSINFTPGNDSPGNLVPLASVNDLLKVNGRSKIKRPRTAPTVGLGNIDHGRDRARSSNSAATSLIPPWRLGAYYASVAPFHGNRKETNLELGCKTGFASILGGLVIGLMGVMDLKGVPAQKMGYALAGGSLLKDLLITAFSSPLSRWDREAYR